MAVFTPKIDYYELMVVQGDKVTADLLVWRRYKIALAGTRLVETFLDVNPNIARFCHKYGPFIPPGTPVKMPIDLSMLGRSPKPLKTISLYATLTGGESETI